MKVIPDFFSHETIFKSGEQSALPSMLLYEENECCRIKELLIGRRDLLPEEEVS